jgi:hypothetical protein
VAQPDSIPKARRASHFNVFISQSGNIIIGDIRLHLFGYYAPLTACLRRSEQASGPLGITVVQLQRIN